jgi:hypothetical protein
MRKIAAVLFVLVALLAATTFGAAKSYQFTGIVKTIQGDTFTVQKNADETWEFSKGADTKGTLKTGDRVTVHYKMIATEIEANPGPKK